MERDYDFTAAPHAADLVRPKTSAAAPASARSRAPIRARSKPARCRSCSIRAFPARWSVIWSARSTARRSRARRVFSRIVWASNCSRAISASSTIPCAGAACARSRSTPRASRSEKLALVDSGVLTTWLLDCATARELGLSPRATPIAACRPRRRRDPYNLHLEAGEPTPERTDLRYSPGLLRHRSDRLGRQRRDRRLQPRRLGLLDRERQDHLSRERGDDRRSSA